MLNWLANLTPEQQIVLAGMLTSALIYAGRYIAPKFFGSEEGAAKAQKFILALVLSGLATIGTCAAAGACSGAAFIIQWLMAWAVSQGLHNAAKRI